MSLAEKDFLTRRGVDFRSASVLSRGRPVSRFTHLRSLQGLICDAKSPRSDTGSSPINHSVKVAFPYLSYSRCEQNSKCIIREMIDSQFQWEK